MNLIGAFNLTYNTIGTNELTTLGPTLSESKVLWKKKHNVNFNTVAKKRSRQNNKSTQDITATISYNYNF